MVMLAKLREKVEEIAEAHDLELDAFFVSPDPDGDGVHIAQAVFHLEPELAFRTDAQRETDDKFAEIALGEMEADLEIAQESARAQLTEQFTNLRRDDGIGLD